MWRIMAALAATIIALVGIVSVIAAVSWFMHSPIALVFTHIPPGAMVIFWPTFTVFWILWWTQRDKSSSDETDGLLSNKPAPRLWLRALQPHKK